MQLLKNQAVAQAHGTLLPQIPEDRPSPVDLTESNATGHSGILSALDIFVHDDISVRNTLQQTYSILSTLPPAWPLKHRALFVLFGLGPRLQCPFSSVHQGFLSQARKYPDAVAVEHLGEIISFFELDRISTYLAKVLQQKGCRPGARVCLLVQRSIAMVAGILAILKSGAAYVPLDGAIVTDSTFRFVLQDSNAAIVMFCQPFGWRVPCSIQSICLESAILECNITQTPLIPPIMPSSGYENDEAYVIYTSGTTGKPKGVSVSHRNLTNLLSVFPGKLEMKPGLRVGQTLNVAFDMCAWEVLGSLMNGCTLCIRGSSKDHWRRILMSIDILITTPSILQMYEPCDFRNIQCIATAGEPCPQALADRWCLTASFFNSCGPTETTIVNTVHKHQIGDANTIGRPTPNNSVYILDENRQPTAIGAAGTMWASGAGLSNGYLNLHDLTAQKFVLDPFKTDGSLMFNTGDLACWTENGELQHLGRIDDQVKVKGFRVELDGVASTIQSHPKVKSATVLQIQTSLWAFVSPAEIDPQEIHNMASSILPYYALPCTYVLVEQMPITSNGKVDKTALRSHASTLSPKPQANELFTWKSGYK